MLLIILSHVGCNRIYQRIYSPVFLSGFFWVSGYTTKSNRSTKEFSRSKFKGLVIPFLSLGTINLMFGVLFEHDSFADRAQFLLSRMGIWDDLWFLACLLSAQFIFWLLEKICLKICRIQTKEYWSLLLTSSLLITAIGLCYVRTIAVPLPLQFENACIYTLYISLGFLCRAIESKYLNINASRCILYSVLYLLIVFAVDNIVSVHREYYDSFLLYFLASGVGIIVIANFCTIMERCYETTVIVKALVFIGQNTLVYYAFQSKVITFIRIVFDNLRHILPHYLLQLLLLLFFMFLVF